MGMIVKNGVNYSGSGGNVESYNGLSDKPQINGVSLMGNKTSGDLGIITKAVNDLINYYLKSETYSKTEVDTIVAAIKNSRFEVVSTLPTTDIQTNVIYLVPSSDPQTSNVKDEYINLDGTTAGWELIGNTSVDLTGYVTTSDLNTALAAYTTTTDLTTLLAAKQDALTAGDGIDITGDTISIDPMPAADMDDVVDELPNGNRVAVTGYVPLGTLIPFYGETAPKFFLACDGSTYNKADYPELANHLLSLTNNTPYIVDGDNTKFKVPDLRGEFIRGTGTNSHSNNGNGANVGVHQDGTQFPVYGLTVSSSKPSLNIYHAYNSSSNPLADTSAINLDKAITRENTNTIKRASINGSGLTEGTTSMAYEMTVARPTNTSVLFCIAYKDIYSNPMNDYSTDEKVVGTWINGDTIYQRTYSGTSPNSFDVTEYNDFSISNMSKLISIEGTINNSFGNYAYYNNNPLFTAWMGGTPYHLLVKISRDNEKNKPFNVTVRYTKTT